MSLHNPSIGDFKGVKDRWLDLGGNQWIPTRPDSEQEKYRKIYDAYIKALDEKASSA